MAKRKDFAVISKLESGIYLIYQDRNKKSNFPIKPWCSRGDYAEALTDKHAMSVKFQVGKNNPNIKIVYFDRLKSIIERNNELERHLNFIEYKMDWSFMK